MLRPRPPSEPGLGEMSEEDPSEALPDAPSPEPGPSSVSSGADMNYEKRRLETFHLWPSNAAVEPRKIAKAGFFYTGNELEVCCFCCNRTLSEWDYDDQVMVKHRTLSPDCPFVVSPLECGNVPILRRESSAFSQAQVDYRIESERLASYRGWSSPHVTPEALARNGLYYLREDDKVACAFCSVQLFDWKAGDDSLLEHRRFSPNCPLLMGYLVGNVALDESGSGALIDHGEDDDNYEIVSTTSEESDVTGILEPEQVVIHPFSGPDDLTAGNTGNVQLANNPRFGAVVHRPPIHPRYQTIQSRLASFTGWPRESPSANTLAAAGFFYQGMNDHASCFHCNGGLHNWDPSDDPWAEHARWFSRCPYVNIVKGQDYINEIIKDKPPIISVEKLNLNGGAGAPPAPEESNEETNQVVNGADNCVEEEVVAEAVEAQPENLETEENTTEENKNEDGEENASKLPEKPRCGDDTDLMPDPGSDGSTMSSEAHLCKVCLDEDVGVVFLPCGHLVTCVQCAPNLSLCPVCRKEIQASVRTYFS